MISLLWIDLAVASTLILALALLNMRLRLGQSRQLLVSTGRMFIQLVLVGFILKALFTYQNILIVSVIAIVMIMIAGYEIVSRQHRRFVGGWSFSLGVTSMFVSSLTLAVFALLVLIEPTPWYTPQYAIPLLGMLLGNTMNGISLALDRLTEDAWQQQAAIEGQLMLGKTSREAILLIERASLRSALTPTINAMAVSGIVALPGMMTGQIMAGADPLDAVKYQILIMLLIATGVGFGSLIAVWFGARRLFDHRQRLRLDRLTTVDK